MYKITEIFASIQGEGSFTGLPVVFVRFAGCNVGCEMCDTDYSLKEELSEWGILARIEEERAKSPAPFLATVVFTGGEPMLQIDSSLIDLIKSSGWDIHLETSGTVGPTGFGLYEFDHVSLSPKCSKRDLKVDLSDVDDLKIVFPPLQEAVRPEEYQGLTGVSLFLQPLDSGTAVYIQPCIEKLSLLKGGWRIGVQVHKMIGVE
jgi:7-carboxy-7-deazaguanine synthase